jgi:hypothetical protein
VNQNITAASRPPVIIPNVAEVDLDRLAMILAPQA